MKARYAGTCIICEGSINPGDQIMWVQHEGAWHMGCTEMHAQGSDKPGDLYYIPNLAERLANLHAHEEIDNRPCVDAEVNL